MIFRTAVLKRFILVMRYYSMRLIDFVRRSGGAKGGVGLKLREREHRKRRALRSAHRTNHHRSSRRDLVRRAMPCGLLEREIVHGPS